MSEPILCDICDKELSEEKGEYAHGCLDCHGQPYSDKLFWARKELAQAKQLIKELASGLDFYTHEKFRPGWEVSGIMMGHKFDISCAACDEQSRGRKAREVLSKNKDLIQRLTEEGL